MHDWLFRLIKTNGCQLINLCVWLFLLQISRNRTRLISFLKFPHLFLSKALISALIGNRRPTFVHLWSSGVAIPTICTRFQSRTTKTGDTREKVVASFDHFFNCFPPNWRTRLFGIENHFLSSFFWLSSRVSRWTRSINSNDKDHQQRWRLLFN